ncbi:hypothetical protein DRH13_06095, partial [Candidatus Woesebacteria bacterium]
QDLSRLRNVSFKDFIKEAFGISHMWYKRMKDIIAFDNGNGRSLFLKYGRQNMVTFILSTPEERQRILEKAEKSVMTRTFSSIKCELFPKARPKLVKNLWKDRYEKLKREFEKYRAETEKTINTLKETIWIVSGKEIEQQKKQA